MPFPKFTCHARLVLTWHSCCSRKVVQKAGHKSKHICNFWCWCNFTAEKAQLFSFPIHQTFPPPPFFGWHGRHCIWWLRGLIWLGSWFASFASELAWQLHSDIFLLFVEGKQKLGCFSCFSHDVTYNWSTQREATFQLIQSQNPSSLIPVGVRSAPRSLRFVPSDSAWQRCLLGYLRSRP